MNGDKREEYDRGICRGDATKRRTGGNGRLATENATVVSASATELDEDTHSDGAKLLSKSVPDLMQFRQRRKERGRTQSLSGVRRCAGEVVGGKVFVGSRQGAESSKGKEAGRRVVGSLMLNAWRRRREDGEETRAIVRTLSNEVGSLNMQVYVMRQLLDSKRSGAISAAKDLRKQLSKIEKYEEEKKSLLKEKESLECEVKDLQDAITDLQSKCKNLENDLNTARSEAETWEATLEKERKKLKVVKEENSNLRVETKSKNCQLDHQSQLRNELELKMKELRRELHTRVQLLQEAEEKLKLLEKEEMKRCRTLAEKEREIEKLREELAEAERRFREQDERNGELGKTLSEKTKEMEILNEKLAEFARSERFWSKRMLKMASLCTRIPTACLYTVATLLLPQPWYRLL